jgi:hypothetical protein
MTHHTPQSRPRTASYAGRKDIERAESADRLLTSPATGYPILPFNVGGRLVVAEMPAARARYQMMS